MTGMGKRILAAEDSPTQAEKLRADLEDAGFEIDVVGTGEEAVALYDERRYDLVVSDVVMPGIDGYETCRRIKARGRDVPVILLTSLTDPIEIVHGLEAGADNFLRKPYDAEQLAARLRTMLIHRELRATGRASVGLEVMLRGHRFMITAERQQILDLLVSSFEDLVDSNAQLREREEALTAAQTQLQVQLDATERERLRVATVLGAAPEPMVIVDERGFVTDTSDQFAALVGEPGEALLGRPVWELLRLVDAGGVPVPYERLPLAAALRGAEHELELGASFDLFVEFGDGGRAAVLARGAPVRDASGRVVAAVGSFHDLAAVAAHDAVTKLPNQVRFADRVAQALGDAAEHGGTVGVLALVLDRFRLLQEHLPAQEANAVLAAVADRLRALAESDAVATHGGEPSLAYLGSDAFGVLLAGMDDELDCVRVANVVFEQITDGRLHSDDLPITVQVSVGLAVAGRSDTGAHAVELIASAAGAARRATSAGGGRVEIADAAIDARAGSWLRREAELRTAIETEQLRVHYQPHVDLRAGQPVGMEALVRWQHPERGLLTPAAFLPLAEQAGLIVALGWWVLGEACRQAAEWRRSLRGAEALLVSVNIDAAQLADPEVSARVLAALEASGLPPEALVLEITESGVMGDADLAATRLRELKGLGIRLAVDDFGTGYSSLAHLRRFPFDFLKVDRSFVSGMASEVEDAAIVAASVRLARSLGLDTIAEGVETEDELVQLRMVGCDLAQGYHWAKPMPADELASWWEANVDPDQRVGAALPISIEDGGSSALDEAIAYLIHELRTPLTSIVAYSQLASRVDDDEQRSGFLEVIGRNARDLDSRIALLAEARAATDATLRLEPVEVQLVGAIQDLVHDLEPQLANRPIVVDANGDAVARVDPLRLRQALANLLTNAVKFSPPDSAIEVRVERVDDRVEVAVRDHGPGVPEERRPELFRRFARLGSRQKGMGVGLYLVRAIARAHGGDARYEPAPDGGACFILSVPAAN